LGGGYELHFVAKTEIRLLHAGMTMQISVLAAE